MTSKVRTTTVLLTLWVCGSVSMAQTATDEAIEVFAPAAVPLNAPPPRPYALNERAVMVDIEALAASDTSTRINFDLVVGSGAVGVVDWVERRGEKRFSLFGHVADYPLSSFILVAEIDAVAGYVQVPSIPLFVRLAYFAGGVHRLFEVDSGEFPPCGVSTAKSGADAGAQARDPQRAEVEPADDDSGGGERGSCTRPQAVFDVVIVFTNIARDAAGGWNAITAECQLAIDGANQGYANSGVNARMRLVYRWNVNYDENGDFDDHLSRLTDPGDGIMDVVHTWRNTYKADVVSLWVNDTDGGSICGLGHCDVDEDEAFSVVNWGCAVSNFSFQHEIGHNQGCAHNDEDCSFPCYCAHDSYSYGWRFFGNSGRGWRTVMAYNNDAGDYTRINWFSNPSVGYDGQPTGVDGDADNTRTLNVTRRHVEGFRNSGYDVWVDFGFGGTERGTFDEPFNTVAEGAAAIVNGDGASENPVLWIKAGATGETLTINKHMVIRACGGTVTIGQ